MHKPKRIIAALTVLCAFAGGAAADETIIVQSTTSTANSGLYNYLLPIAREATGVDAKIVAVGSGQAIKNASNCDGDVLLVHARDAEEAFVRDGFGSARYDLMYNDFVIVGPSDDPAGIASVRKATDAFAAIAGAKVPFVSRGDDSGTHRAEQAIWALSQIDPMHGELDWYRQTGSGMGAALNIAAGMNAYLLVDRATWASFANRGDLALLLEGDRQLINQYGIIAVNPQHCPAVNAAAAQRFVSFLISPEGQAAIAAFKPDGQPLFFPNAAP